MNSLSKVIATRPLRPTFVYSFGAVFVKTMDCANIFELSQFVKYGKTIVGAALNYRSLIAERNLAVSKEPVMFLKAASSYITEGESIRLPENCMVNEEVELGVIIGKTCKNVPESKAMDHVGGYCLALDLTEVNMLKEARSKGLPWIFGKSFDTACPVSRMISLEELKDPSNVKIWCSVNGNRIQEESTSDMVFPIEKLISHVSKYMTLEYGDMILTGSPAGVGPIVPGDVVEAGVSDIVKIKFPVISTQRK